MNDIDGPDTILPSVASCDTAEMTIAELIGKVYDVAPTTERCRMLEYLMKPLGALGLVAISNGIFAKIWFRSGWHELHIRPEDAGTVRGIDVVSLVAYVQQASSETVDGLVSVLTTSPMMVYSATAAMLVTMLVRRFQNRRNTSAETRDVWNSDSHQS